jgi:hypothetical protein
MRAVPALMLLSFAWLTACDNACQSICTRMARYAEDCGYTVAEGDLEDCKAEQSTPEARELNGVCRDYNSQATIEAEYTCEEIAFYWGVE